jgi:hypothetical protein
VDLAVAALSVDCGVVASEELDGGEAGLDCATERAERKARNSVTARMVFVPQIFIVVRDIIAAATKT